MPLSDGDPITRSMLATAADLLHNARPDRTTVLVDSVGRTVRITCRCVDREWMRALAAAGASGSHARPSIAQLDGLSREAIERAVVGGLKAAINDHGPITADLLASAAKRIVGHLKSPGG